VYLVAFDAAVDEDLEEDEEHPANAHNKAAADMIFERRLIKLFPSYRFRLSA
jgi:hypothetical protein